MDLILIELVLWAGLVFFFWALKDSLSHMESDLESLGLLNEHQVGATLKRLRYDRPEKVIEAIGSYKDAKIYRFAIIDGHNYQFDHIYPVESSMEIQKDERCLEPGLVYVACDEQGLSPT